MKPLTTHYLAIDGDCNIDLSLCLTEEEAIKGKKQYVWENWDRAFSRPKPVTADEVSDEDIEEFTGRLGNTSNPVYFQIGEINIPEKILPAADKVFIVKQAIVDNLRSIAHFFYTDQELAEQHVRMFTWDHWYDAFSDDPKSPHFSLRPGSWEEVSMTTSKLFTEISTDGQHDPVFATIVEQDIQNTCAFDKPIQPQIMLS